MPPITEVRGRIRSIMEHHAGDTGNPDVVILAIDGITHDLAAASWAHARTERMQSVFPTTSATGWLSSLSGADPAVHGVLGVVFRIPDVGGQPIDVFTYRGALGCPELGNIFSDATELGYAPLALLGDLADYNCAWRELLLRHATPIPGQRFFTHAKTETGCAQHDPATLSERVLKSVTECLARSSPRKPRLVWCFIEADRRIHLYGYDDYTVEFLHGIDEVGAALAERDAVVVAHSDHGLTPTRDDGDIGQLLARIERECAHAMGGAGRTRWLYPHAHTRASLEARLRRQLPPTVRVGPTAELFPAASRWRARVGTILLLAEGECFVTSPGYTFDHGSLTTAELDVPFSEWCS
jgi:Type I phosphodiesterase / nucleotide pyrophosphatase